jgi:hypothetical protein
VLEKIHHVEFFLTLVLLENYDKWLVRLDRLYIWVPTNLFDTIRVPKTAISSRK